MLLGGVAYHHAFQFHKGTIKTLIPTPKPHVGNVFQFHKGTIKTYGDLGFIGNFDYFNSIKVRLKLVGNRQILNGVCVFQFHKGTIKTICLDTTANGIVYFNSIKVRLKLFSPRHHG